MFRLFDILVLSSAVGALLFSVLIYLNGHANMAMYVGLWVSALLGFGIYIKLLRIIHFVLYKNLDQENES